jgi:outer membrane protein TolC
LSWPELKAINDALAEFMRLIGREPDAVEHVFAEPGRPREHYDIPLVLLVEMLRRRDGLSVRAATRKASALTIGKAIRLFPQSENTLRKR